MLLLKRNSISAAIVILFAVAASFVACRNRGEATKTPIRKQVDSTSYVFADSKKLTINTDKSKPITSLSSIGQIVLDISQDEFPGYVSEMIVRNDTIFLCDNYKAPGVYVYSIDGKLLNCYTSRGIGPDDFMRLQDLQVSTTEISAYDDAAGKIIVLDKEAHLIGKYDVNPYAVSAYLGNDRSLYVDFSNFHMADMKLGIRGVNEPNSALASILVIPEHKLGIRAGGARTFQKLGSDEFIYSPAFDDVIYTVHDNDISPRYLLDFGKDWWTDDEFREISKRNDWAPRLKSFPIQNLIAVESDTHLAISFKKNEEFFYYIYDKNKDSGLIFKDTDRELTSILELVNDTVYIRRIDDSIEVRKIPTI